MDMNKIFCEVAEMADEEMQRAKATYGGNHSRHEGFGIFQEEFEEFESEYDRAVLKKAGVWQLIKADAEPEEMRKKLSELRTALLLTAGELIQAIAMVQKMTEYENQLEELQKQTEKYE